MADELKFEVKGRVAWLTMNRPEVHNALSYALNQALADAWEEVRNNDDIWIAVLTGAGRSFCSGMDLKERAAVDARGEDWSKKHTVGSGMPEGVWKPVIAAIRGYCLAGGWQLAQLSDFRFVSEEATLGIREVKRGLMPAWTVDLPRIIGLGNALEVVLTGEYITPQRALEMGFATRVVPDDKLLEEVEAFTQILLENAPALRARAQGSALPRRHADPPRGPPDRPPHPRPDPAQRGHQGGPARLRGEAPAGLAGGASASSLPAPSPLAGEGGGEGERGPSRWKG